MYLSIKLEVYTRLLQIFRKDKNKKRNNCILISQNILKT